MEKFGDDVIRMKKSRKKVFLFGPALVLLLAVFAVIGIREQDSDRARLEDIKKEKEICVILHAMGYPGDDPLVSPGNAWELKEEDGSSFWYNAGTGAKLIPVMEDGSEEVSFWFYEDADGERYKMDPDETYQREE